MNDKVVDMQGKEVAVEQKKPSYKTITFYGDVLKPADEHHQYGRYVVEATEVYKKVTGYQVNDKFVAIVQDKLTTLIPHAEIVKIEIKE